MPRASSRANDDPIPEDLLNSIPDVGKGGAATTFAIEAEEVIAPPAPAGVPGQSVSAALAQQLRYDLGEALARELDKASETFASNIADLEARLQQAEAALMATHQALDAERDAREAAERRLQAFKELALK
ncbi:MAG TPA: hypothetical protein VFH78_06220 [Candidatus Thermoplasmatota archaeon]|nr:hypothetical protein [Candidatus Thermoplasmatota archaeon]